MLEEFLRAVQVASNPRLIDPNFKSEPAKFLELDQIVSDVVDQNDRKLVIWTNYLKNVYELIERYSKFGALPLSGKVSGDERAETIEKFQDLASEQKILIAVPGAGGVGITLTAAQTAVYLDKTWNGEHWMQSVDRLHRIGQTGTVQVISLHASKVDEAISWSLYHKQKRQAKLLGDLPIEELRPSREELLRALN